MTKRAGRLEVAFLGHNCTIPTVNYRFDGRRLVCWEVWHVRLLKIVAGTLIGPGLTIAILLGLVESIPWYLWIVVSTVNAFAWVGWIDALRNKYQIVIDIVAGNVKLISHPLRPPLLVLKFEEIAAVEIDVIKRAKRGGLKPPTPEMIARHRITTIDHFNLVAVCKDGRRVYLLESIEKSVPTEVKHRLERAVAEVQPSIVSRETEPSWGGRTAIELFLAAIAAWSRDLPPL